MKNLSKLLFALSALSAFSLQAATVTYSSRASFDAAAGATTLIDFEAQATNLYYTVYGNSLTVGDVTFTDSGGSLLVLGDFIYSTNVGSNFLNNNSGGPLIGINFANPVYSFGLDWAYVYSWGGGSTIDVALSTGGSFTIGLTQLYGSNAGLSFWGITSDAAISSITITDYTQGLALDNVAYSASPASVPDTGLTVWMMGSGLLALLAVSRRRRA